MNADEPGPDPEQLQQTIVAVQDVIQTPWQWFVAQPSEAKRATIMLLCAPGAGAILTTFFFMASLRRMYKWGDIRCFWTAMGIAAVVGPLWVFFLSAPINQAVGYEFYDHMAVFGAAVLTPFVNHWFFRIVVFALYLGFLVGDSLPPQHAMGWLASPIRTASRALYYQLTGKDLGGRKRLRKEDPEPDDDDTLANFARNGGKK